MNALRPKHPALSARRLIRLTLVAFAVTPLVLGGCFWLNRHVPRWVYWKASLIFLFTTEILYLIAAAVLVPTLLLIGSLLFTRPSSRHTRQRLARTLLLGLSLGFALLMAETTSALWRARTPRDIPVPPGALYRDSQPRPEAPMPESASASDGPTEFHDLNDGPEIDIAVLGESSAEGVPYNRWVSIGSILQWQLEKSLPGRRVRLQVLAASGSTLRAQERLLSRLAYRPEILLIYSGHNEITARIDPTRDTRHYVDEQLPSAWTLFVEEIEAISPFCGLIRETADKCRVAIPPPRSGNRKLIDVPAFTGADFTAILVNFRRRLEAMVTYAEKIGAMPVLISPAANDAGLEPNRSFLSADTPRHEREAIARDFIAARQIEVSNPRAAQADYRNLLARQPGFAEAHYRLAKLLERDGAWEEAYAHYREARDLDGYPIRCPSALQAVYHEVADRQGCILVDSQSYFHAVGRHGLLDDHLFHDGMHPTLRGQIALAQAVLHELHARRAFGWPASAPAPVIDPLECVERFDIDASVWMYICTWGILFYDMTCPIRYEASRRERKKEAFGQAFDRIAAGEPPESVGLPNIGLPEPVPSATSGQIRGDMGPAIVRHGTRPDRADR
jgi:hypothetical protein